MIVQNNHRDTEREILHRETIEIILQRNHEDTEIVKIKKIF